MGLATTLQDWRSALPSARENANGQPPNPDTQNVLPLKALRIQYSQMRIAFCITNSLLQETTTIS